MKRKLLLIPCALLIGLACASSLRAQNTLTWNAGNGDFFTGGNWDLGLVPGATDTAIINNGSTATIAATAGDRELGSLKLGSIQGGTESGHVIMNGGFLRIGGNSGDSKVNIGEGTVMSSFIMNGGTIFFDVPDREDIAGTTVGSAGLSNLDWEIGERGIGRFEVHGDSVFRAGDDIKVAENSLGNGYCLIDGNARVSVGSGISVSSGGANEQILIIGGNALVEAGNSMGAGSPLGHNDEGYLTLSIGGGRATVTVQDNAVLNFRVLSSRQGVTKFTVKNRGQVHIFDVLTGKGYIDAQTPPDRPEVVGGFNNSLSSGPDTDSTLTLQDDAQMTVNASAGLAISGPRDGGSAQGGKALFTIRDRASFRVEQYLAIGSGTRAETTDGTLEVIGPDASISIGSNLNMATDPDGFVPTTDLLDEFGNPVPGKATLRAVITSSSHSTVRVGGIARITHARLHVKLDGHVPVTGTVYTLVTGNPVEGQFAQTDFTEATLPAGLSWELEYKPESVLLKVTGQPVGPRVLTVTTTDNINPPAGKVSLLQAMTGLQEGDTVKFNIEGAGPHVIATPPGGYPLITANNVTIDGYSQPGATPNSNSVRAPNNAKIQIVLDSRNGNHRLMDFAPTSPNDQTGYGDTEAAVIGILSAKGVHVRGVSILAQPLLVGASPNGEDVALYGISFAKGASGQVSGCWIGVAPDGTTLAGPADGVTGFRYRVRDENNTVLENILINDVIIGVKPGATDAASELNVITGIPAIPIIIEGERTRISGNFLNVMPDGLHDFNPPLANPDLFTGTFEGNIEIGRGGNGTLIGTDGDGVNDAFEGNILSGVVPESIGGYDHNIEFYGQNPGTGIVIAGNYIGIGVDGMTRFTNGVPVLNAAGGSAQYRFGSDFDGVSDALEANHCYNNYPVELFGTNGAEGFFDELSTGGIVGARGNVMVNNFPFPVSPLRMSGADTFWKVYYTKALANPEGDLVPVLSPNTTASRLIGTVPVANTDYPVTLIDLYKADPEGIAFGKTAAVPELPNGFVQGRTYVASFQDNSDADLNKTAGQFEFDISALGVGGSDLTVTANYSKSAAGTHNAVVLTSPFSEPVTVGQGPAPELVLNRPTRAGNNIVVSWTGGRAPYTVQKKTSLNDAEWVDVDTTSETSLSVAMVDDIAFIRVVSRVTFTVALSGAAERPNPVTTSGTGTGTLILDGNKLTVDISYSGLTGTVSAGHIHGPATTEQAVGVLKGLIPGLGTTGATSGTIKGETTVNSATAKHMIAGMTYVNIHTSFAGGGEIRGQVIPQP
ncbi:MAG: CHRD domain-containing protein [Verrucomicrobiota bacterium]